MCDLGLGVLERGFKDGLAQGLERGIEQGVEQGVARGLAQGLEQGVERGLAQGLEQGIEKGDILARQDVARTLLSMGNGMSIETVAMSTKLSIDEVKKIQQELL